MGKITIRYGKCVRFMIVITIDIVVKLTLIVIGLGITRGNIYELGDFDECMNIYVPNKFEPRYW